MKPRTIEDYRKVISDKLFEVITNVQGVLSVTIVGSFSDHDDLSTISDIDTIVICEELTQDLYEKCVNNVRNLTGEELGFSGRSVYTNPTLGPLKFDTKSLIVVHLMIYDIEGHRRHVLESPFTCYDWERSDLHTGPLLKEIYPVLKLQPRDYLQARRGLRNYIEDIGQGVISYRRYNFENGKVKEVLEHKRLDSRHRGEYAFHIVKSLVANYCKLVIKDNTFLNDDELIENWRRFLPGCAYFIPYFKQLSEIKRKRKLRFPSDTIAKVKDFVLQFEKQFTKYWQHCPTLQFTRHAPTAFNDESFLGQGRDPAITKEVKIHPLERSVGQVFCSPLKRAVQTARCLAPKAIFIKDPRLLEIQYGRAEGLTYAELKKKFPEMAISWKKGEDPCFPEGENTAMVCRRLKSFLNEQRYNQDSCLVVTHNVVLRCLIGYLYGIPQEKWCRLKVPHLELIEVLNREKDLYPNFSTEIKTVLTDSLLARS